MPGSVPQHPAGGFPMRGEARPIPAPCMHHHSVGGGGNLVHEPKFWSLWDRSQSVRDYLACCFDAQGLCW